MWTIETARKVSEVDPSEWMSLLRLMVLSRRIDERLIALYRQGRIRGSVFAGIGQEAIGAAAALCGHSGDLYAPCIRNLAVHLGRGETALGIMRQALGRETGPTGGRDGNVHHGLLQNGVYAMISHLGAMISVVAGGVMARRRRGDTSVGVAFVGDGATSTGDFHEALNFASVFDVPLLVIVENNHYAYSTPTSRQYRCRHLADRAAGYGVEGFRADGNNAAEMYVTVRDLLAELRARPRPAILECETMRMRGHGEHDDFAYVPRELLAVYGRRDPIKLAVRAMNAAGMLKDGALEALEQSVTEEIEAACRQALAEPEPFGETLLDGVYSDA